MLDDSTSLVSQRLRAVRQMRHLSLRDLAEASGVSINTISLIERGKTSPTIATLHRLAGALGVLISDFVEPESGRSIVYLKRDQRQQARSACALIESLGTGLPDQMMEPLLITLEPESDSGPEPIIHLGHELVVCLQGQVVYQVDGQEYLLETEDSLLFEASLPHRWRNVQPVPARALLVIQSPQGHLESSRRHF